MPTWWDPSCDNNLFGWYSGSRSFDWHSRFIATERSYMTFWIFWALLSQGNKVLIFQVHGICIIDADMGLQSPSPKRLAHRSSSHLFHFDYNGQITSCILWQCFNSQTLFIVRSEQLSAKSSNSTRSCVFISRIAFSCLCTTTSSLWAGTTIVTLDNKEADPYRQKITVF